ncbi:MAG: RIO1 family regulatory kinase/ATPase [Gammaproteobacteria bacterium]|nr:RIO1 family regulatory kinase/ATPase [Gammaproteobacteria bacterium]
MTAAHPATLTDELTQALRAWLADDTQREAALLSQGYQGSAYLYAATVNSQPVRLVIKRAAPGWLTGWLNRLMLAREARVYQRIASVSGVPHSPGMLDDEWLLLEFIEGRPLKAARYDLADPEAFYARLLGVLQDFHAEGVAHGDLKRKQNVLVTADEQPYVIDFGTAVMRDGNMIDRLLFRLVRRFDYNAWVKVKYENDYSAIAPEDARWYRPTLVESVFSGVRRFWRTITFRQARRRRRGARRRAAQAREQAAKQPKAKP